MIYRNANPLPGLIFLGIIYAIVWMACKWYGISIDQAARGF